MVNIFGNSASGDTISFHPEPPTRGTVGILASCLVTIALCVWTAIHLNIPQDNESKFRKLLRKIKWLVVGLLAPELVLFTAWYQFNEAQQTVRWASRRLSSPLNTTTTEENTLKEVDVERNVAVGGNEAGNGDVHKFSKEKAFFLNMGGLAFDTTACDYFLPTPRQRLIYFTPKGLEVLCELHPEIFENIQDDDVQDKSKADGLAKSLVCIQTLWFMIQCISRLAQHLPISLLELNTCGHCLCALLMYGLWWSKPLEVGHPIKIPGSEYSKTLSWMWMYSLPSRKISKTLEISHIEYIPGSDRNRDRELQRQQQFFNSNHPGEGSSCKKRQSRVNIQQEIKNLGLEYKPIAFGFPSGMNETDVHRWGLAATLIKEHWKPQYKKAMAYNTLRFQRHANFIPPTGMSGWRSSLALTIFVVSGLVYGGLHILGWSAPFRTPTEQLLWRLSAPTIMGYSLVFAIHVVLSDIIGLKFLGITTTRDIIFVYRELIRSPMKGFRNIYKDSQNGVADFFNVRSLAVEFSVEPDEDTIETVKSLIFGPLVAIFIFLITISFIITALSTVLYVLARTYIVVECFLNLFHAPEGLFVQPNFASYFPHIG